MTALTHQQTTLLRFIESYSAQHGVCPSFDEMRDALGLRSKSGVNRLVTALEERRAIRRLPNRARAIEVVRDAGGPDIAVTVDQAGHAAVALSDRVTVEWLRHHRDAIDRALSLRLAQATYPVRSAAE